MLACSSLISRLNFAKELGVCARTLDGWSRGGLHGVRLAPVFRGARIYYTWAAYHAWQREVVAARERLLARPPKRSRADDERVRRGLRRHGIEV
jgi:hypothetical protein